MWQALKSFPTVYWQGERSWLFVGSILFSFVFSWLALKGIFPLGLVDFIFFSILIFLSALFRPAWIFLVMISLLPLENINIAAAELHLGLRPYQWCAILLIFAIGLRLLSRRTAWPLFTWNILDTLIALIPVGALLSALVSGQSEAFRLTLILCSYFLMYLLGRIFFKKMEDVFTAAPYFLVGGIGSLIFGLLQNVLFLQGHQNFSVMAGRPNAFFSEPDWFALFLIPLIASLLAFLAVRRRSELVKEDDVFLGAPFWGALGLLLFAFVDLILTVSRSAWLGVVAVLGLFLFLIIFERKQGKTFWHIKEVLFFGNLLSVLLITAIVLVEGLSLTRFELWNRAGSTVSGEQRITIACTKEQALPGKILTLADLVPLGCWHIDLETVEKEKANGQYVTTILRSDPNVAIRKDIYTTVVQAIQTHPVFGIGWGVIGEVLGRDGRGASLNASNVWFELWLGSGLLGLLAFLAWTMMTIWLAIKQLSSEYLPPLVVFFLLTLVGITVFNLFNSGILLGFVWLLMAMAPLFHVKAPSSH